MIAAAMAAAVCFGGCQNQENKSSEQSSKKESSVESSMQSSVESQTQSSNEEGDPSFEEQSFELPAEESSLSEDPEESDVSGEKKSSSDEDSKKESSEEPAYYFDDEQIVTDYHTAEVFTDDAAFNELFAANELDAAYMTESKELTNVADMRNLAITYGEKWREEVDNAYNQLFDLLSDNSAEQDKLITSQQQWVASIEETESSFRTEAESEGTYGLLAADTAMMNYFKSRAAVLYHQIYLLTGSFILK